MLRQIAGQDVWVTQTGSGDPRLFIHCSLARARSLAPLAGALPPATDTFFDLPGHGQSGVWTGEDYHGDTMQIVAHLSEGPTHLIGHSFGATVALRMAIEHPEKVSRLTLIEPVMFAAARGTAALEAHRAAFAPFVTAFSAGDLEAASAAFVGMWGTGPAWADIPEKSRARIMAQIHLIPAAAPVIEEDVLGLVDRLTEVSCSVDLIEGGASQPIMPAIMDGLAAGIPQARRCVIDGADHMVPITHFVETARAISRGTTRD